MGTIPLEKTGQLLTGDEIAVPGRSGAYRLSRFVAVLETAPTGASLVLRAQDVTGGAPATWIELTIPAGQKSGAATGTVACAAGSTFVVRVVSGPAGANAAGYLSGYVEDDLVDSGALLSDVATVKSILGLDTATHDALLSIILASVSRRIQAYCARRFVQAARTDRLSIPTGHRYLILPERPASSVSSVTVDGGLVDPADYVVLADAAMIYRASGWEPEYEHIVVEWTSGEATIPADVTAACAMQTAWEARQAAGIGSLLGHRSKSHEGGGSTTYVEGEWLPTVLETLRLHRRAV